MFRLGAAAALLLLASSASAAQAGLATTNRSHIDPGSSAGAGTVAPGPTGRARRSSLPDFRQPAFRMRVILRREGPLANLGGPNRPLSKACRAGRFRQSVDRLFVAVLGGRIYGAAMGGRSGLFDPQRLASDGLVYVFVGQGTTSCRVYVGGTGSL